MYSAMIFPQTHLQNENSGVLICFVSDAAGRYTIFNFSTEHNKFFYLEYLNILSVRKNIPFQKHYIFLLCYIKLLLFWKYYFSLIRQVIRNPPISKLLFTIFLMVHLH